jgi:iron complex transport system ATP-binding protein
VTEHTDQHVRDAGEQAQAEIPGRLEVEDLSLGYGGERVVRDVSLQIPRGKMTVIVGANGCGKSTLLRGMSRLLKPLSGRVVLDGEDIHRMSPKRLAQRLALLPQSPLAPDGLTVRELVAHGRTPYHALIPRLTEADHAAVDRAMAVTDISARAHDPVLSLSGGQRQRAWIAMTLAQETEVLLLDEPTTYLDLAHQIEVLETIRELNSRSQVTTVMVLHDLNLASRYAHHLIAMKQGQVVAEGSPNEVVTTELVREILELETVITPDPIARTPLVVPRAGAAAVLRRDRRPETVPEGLSPVHETSSRAETSSNTPKAKGRAMADEAGQAAALKENTNALMRSTLAFQTTVADVQQLGQGLVRLVLTGEDLDCFGIHASKASDLRELPEDSESLVDLRIKLVVPADGATAESIGEALDHLRPEAAFEADDTMSWYRRWLQVDPSQRGAMRTYTAAELRRINGRSYLSVDMVTHIDSEISGPAARFAESAAIGDTLYVLGPNRRLCGPEYGGIDFRPGNARRVLLVGDETAQPALCAIAATLPDDAVGDIVIEVPHASLARDLEVPRGVRVSWLVRSPGQTHGMLLDATVRKLARHWADCAQTDHPGEEAELDPVDIDHEILWETTEATGDRYAWIAGEAGVVKGLRRYLVSDLGVDRRSISFMGYWREGKQES